MGKRLIPWLVLAGCVGWVGWMAATRYRSAAPEFSATSSVLTVDHYEYIRSSKFDPGTVRLLLRNSGPHALRLRSIAWDGLPLPTWNVDLPQPAEVSSAALRESEPLPASNEQDVASYDHRVRPEPSAPYRPAYWSRWTREGGLSSGETAWLLVKMAQPLKHPATIRIEGGIWADGASEREKTIPLLFQAIVARTSAVRLYRLAFSDGGREAFVYGENRSDATQRIARVELDGATMREGLWLPQTELPAGGRMVAGLRPATPFTPGMPVTVRLIMADGSTAACRANAYWGFPLGVDGGDGFTPGWKAAASCTLTSVPPWERGTVLSRSRGPLAYGWRAMNCVVCTHGSQGTEFDTAREMLRRYTLSRIRAPEVPVVVNPCRVKPEYGYALFAETADALLANPAVDTSMANVLSPTPDPRSSLEKTVALARVAREASAPGLFYGVLSSNVLERQEWEPGAVVTPAALRARAYALLAAGADGLFLRHNSRAVRAFVPELNVAVNELAGELRQLVPWLSRSAVWGEAEVEGLPEVRAGVRWVGRDGCLVFLMADGAAGEAARQGEDRAAGWVGLELPAWAVVADVSRIGGDGAIPVDEVEPGTSFRFRVDAPIGGAAYLVRLVPESNREAEP